MTRRLAAAPQPPERPKPPDLVTAVTETLAGMTWLTESDRGLRALALNYADQIEAAAARREELDQAWAEARGDRSITKRLERLEAAADATKMIGWLGPQLQGVLRDLGGTPLARTTLNPKQPVGGRLAALRDSVAATTGAAGEHDPTPVD